MLHRQSRMICLRQSRHRPAYDFVGATKEFPHEWSAEMVPYLARLVSIAIIDKVKTQSATYE
jgi:hypothetical protein